MTAPTSKKIIIGEDRCKGCKLCILFCAKNAIVLSDKINKFGVAPAQFTGDEKCSSCGNCYMVCPEYCIEVFKI